MLVFHHRFLPSPLLESDRVRVPCFLVDVGKRELCGLVIIIIRGILVVVVLLLERGKRAHVRAFASFGRLRWRQDLRLFHFSLRFQQCIRFKHAVLGRAVVVVVF